MTIYSDYVTVPHQTYNEWRTATLGNGYQINGATDLLSYYFVSVFWYNLGFPTNYPYTGGGYGTIRIWNNRLNNASYNGVDYFDIITSLNDVKRGDVVLYNSTYELPNGICGFADTDYNGGDLTIIAQEIGTTPYIGGGTVVSINTYPSSLFLGAFRYKGWHGEPPVPPVPPLTTRSKFNWAIYARKLRDKRKGL